MSGAVARLRRLTRFDASEAPARRAEVRVRLEALLRHVLEASAFYGRDRALFESMLAEPDDDRFFALYAQVTPLAKDDLVSRLDAIVTDPEITTARIATFDAEHADGLGVLHTALGDHQVLKTSGTSGTVVYVLDRVDNIKRCMGELFFRALVGVLVRARLWPVLVPMMRPWVRLFRQRPTSARAVPASAAGRPGLGERLARFFRPSLLVFVHRGNRSVYRGTTSNSQPLWVRLILHMRLISHEESLASILQKTQWQDPELIFGLPSRVEWLARAQIAGELAIDPLAVYVGGETLHAELLALYRRAWPNTLIINTYGATETKAIATACAECGELHVLEDFVLLELEADDGGPVSPEQPAARVYCTSLRNSVTPVLRYAMTDRIVPLEDRGCRLRTQRIRVEGREPAFLWAPHRRTREWIPLNGRMLKERLVALEGASGFMVRYDTPGRIEVSIVSDALDEPSRQALAAAAERCVAALAEEQGSQLSDLFEDVALEVVDSDTWNRRGGKLNAISTKVAPPSLEASSTSLQAVSP